ncbi:MAG: metal ABC transporter ATP-binding protein, partial [Ruoffia tabacinasalis]
MTNNAITVDQLTVAYDGHPVLWNVDVKFLKGQRTAIVGPNGAGKSTLLNGMLGLLKPIAGQVTYQLDGESYRYEEVKRRLAYVPQRTSVDWDFPTSALDAVLMGRYGHLKFGQRPSK